MAEWALYTKPEGTLVCGNHVIQIAVPATHECAPAAVVYNDHLTMTTSCVLARHININNENVNEIKTTEQQNATSWLAI